VTALLDPVGEIIAFDQHGQAIVEWRDTDLGDCAGCGEIIYGRVKRPATRGNVDGGWIAERAAMWRAVPREVTRRLILEPWHFNCHDRYVIAWAMVPDRMVHRAGCVHVHGRDDAIGFTGRRREAEWFYSAFDMPGRWRGFCDLCADVDFWWEPYIGGQVTDEVAS
jgi:hypothetical protein